MTVDKAALRELLAGLPLVKWSKTGSTVNIPETEDFAGKALHITGLDKQYARRLAGYIAAVNPATVSALLAENDALRAELQARQWISTSDQMPRENDLVLACHIDGDTEIVFGHLLHETKQDGAYSHWQTLPPAPPQGETA